MLPDVVTSLPLAVFIHFFAMRWSWISLSGSQTQYKCHPPRKNFSNGENIGEISFCQLATSDVAESHLSSLKHFESKSSKFFSSQIRVMTWSSHKKCGVTSKHWFASSSQCRFKLN